MDESTRQAFINLVDDMTSSISAARQVLRERQKEDLDMKGGISLLSLKHHVLLSYLQSLLLVSSRRGVGHSLLERKQPKQSFGDLSREARGSGAGDLVDAMIEDRIVLEKIKVLEGRMKYQIEKLVRQAEDTGNTGKDMLNDPLAFRPNPQNLVNDEEAGTGGEESEDDGVKTQNDSIYRPPRLAPMPYTETHKDKKARRGPVPSALSSLLQSDPSRPHMESTSGLGTIPSLSSARAKDLQRITQFEEDNFTRVMMKKKDARRRLRDEEDIALGGSASISSGAGKTRRRGGGLEDEFNDVLKSVGRARISTMGDGYEELRQKGRKSGVLERSRISRPRSDAFTDDHRSGEEDGGRKKKRTRFDFDVKATKRRLKRAEK